MLIEMHHASDRRDKQTKLNGTVSLNQFLPHQLS